MEHRGGLLWLALMVGCGGAAASYPPAWVGTDDARRTGSMAGDAQAPQLPRDTLMDEAVLAYADGQTACFDVIVRSPWRQDAALTGLGARCTAGEGAPAPAEPSSTEMLSVYDYDEDGDVIGTEAEDVPAASYDPSGAEPPSEGLHRVVERHARLCCEAPAADALVLSLGSLELSWTMR